MTYDTLTIDDKRSVAIRYLDEVGFIAQRDDSGVTDGMLIDLLLDEGWEIGWDGDGFWFAREDEIWTSDGVFKNLVKMGKLDVRDFPGLFDDEKPRVPRRFKNKVKRRRRKVKRAKRDLNRFD